MSPEVISSILGLIGVVITVIWGGNKIKKTTHGLKQAEGELKLQRQALDFGAFVEEWGGTYKEIEHLLDSTEIDRFMMLRAWNGKLCPRWTTAIFQVRQGDQTPVSYVHFELDKDYVQRLREISLSGLVHLRTADLAPCAIKAVYEAEGVTESVWVHIQSEKVEGSETVAHTYASFATKTGAIEETTVTKCSILAGRIKGVAHSFKSV